MNRKIKVLITVLLLLLVMPAYGQVVHWVQMSSPYPESIPPNDLESNSITLFIATDSGLYGTTNDGVNWVREIGLRGKPVVYSLLQRDSVLFATTAPFGITDVMILNKSTDGGVKWDSCNLIGAGDLLANKKGLILGGGLDGRLFRSTDDGSHWTTADSSTPGIYKRIDLISLSDNFSLAFLDSEGITKLIISIDFCRTWKNVSTNTTLLGGAFAIDGFTFLAGTSNGIFRSRDTGLSWQLVNPDIRRVHFVVADRIIYAFSDSVGVIYSLNQGDTWTAMNDGLPNFAIRQIAIGKDELYAALASGELYHTSFPSSVIPSDRAKVSKLTICPNPANTFSEFSYTIPDDAVVSSLSIYDVLGREIAKPVTGRFQEAGQYKIDVDLHNLSPGIYTCRLATGKSEVFAKFVILH